MGRPATAVTISETAVLQWERVRKALPSPVLLALNDLETTNSRRAVHVLALQDVVRYGRVVVGLDVPPHIIAAESCFCASDGELGKLRFHVSKIRAEQDLYTIPTCSRCLRFCQAVTGLAVDQIKETKIQRGKGTPG